MNAYTTALTLLSRRELSTRQLRERLARRKLEAADIDAAIDRLTADGTLNDRRVAVACARTDAAIKGHGRRRVLQHIQQLGVSADIAASAVAEVFGDLDESGLLDAAIERRLRGASPRSLDANARARLVRHLIGRGFAAADVFARLRRSGIEGDE